ncbi:2-succinylbenzoate--CoA ligase [Synechococcus sp. Nb3U1]|uniref:2-succinylbenzoate--CoA ligase n=1 Tax=Synechococcus sp. Nb3U1 TaxID=1914529 RepID=UPI001F3C6817|nr:2-succinylbenzoate--CoA ligase [Synechococcus sp. Nb3U1]MCF2970305.1 2-succinylbenzoate--CoA ligase [Synechococcus sp. Nb3U1]
MLVLERGSSLLAEHLLQLEAQLRPLAGGKAPLLLAESEPVRVWATFLTCQQLGIPLFLGNPTWGEREWGHALEQMGSGWYWRQGQLQPYPSSVHQPLRDLLNALPAADSPPICIPTGGSSGHLKWAIHSWATLAASARAHQQHFAVGIVHSYCLLPLYHVSGLMQAVRSWLSEGQLVLWDWKPLEYAQQWETPLPGSFLSLVPTQLQRLLLQAHPAVLAALRQFRAVLVGGGPTWPSLREQARQQRIPVALTYGMTETASQVCTSWPEAFLCGNDSLGRPLPHATLQIQSTAGDPVGPIHLWAESLALGYYPHLWQRDQGLVPGDWGYLDEQGSLHWLGRADDLILTGGEKVMAAEVEGEIRATGWVEDVCVLGVPDAEWGQQVIAIVVPTEGMPSDLEDLKHRLKRHLSEQLSGYKCPKQWLCWDGIPRTPQGKVNRPHLRHWAMQALGIPASYP